MQSTVVTYAVGDIHGCSALLDGLLAQIEAHAAGRERCLVFLGDYIDRGPDSAAVVRTLSRLQRSEPEHVVCLMGNHERMLLDALETDDATSLWRANGGEATLESFGVQDAADLPGVALEWLQALPTLHHDAARWYVHAGLRPGVPPEESSTHDRLWIREPFLKGDQDFGRHVVHGHTPQQDGKPQIRRFRTNLDTAAVYSGTLTAGVFTEETGPAIAFLQERR